MLCTMRAFWSGGVPRHGRGVTNERMRRSFEEETDDMTVNASVPKSGSLKSGTMDVNKFMAFMHTRPKGEHWDLIDGVAVMMAPVSHAHRQTALNLCILLRSAFAARGWI
jgi:hypothetical protein